MPLLEVSSGLPLPMYTLDSGGQGGGSTFLTREFSRDTCVWLCPLYWLNGASAPFLDGLTLCGERGWPWGDAGVHPEGNKMKSEARFVHGAHILASLAPRFPSASHTFCCVGFARLKLKFHAGAHRLKPVLEHRCAHFIVPCMHYREQICSVSGIPSVQDSSRG